MSCSVVKPLNIFDTLVGECLTKKNRVRFVTKQSAKLSCFTLKHQFGKLSDRPFSSWDDARCSYKNGVNYSKDLWVSYKDRVWYFSHDEYYNPIGQLYVGKVITPYDISWWFYEVDFDGRFIRKTLIETQTIAEPSSIPDAPDDSHTEWIFTWTQYFNNEIKRCDANVKPLSFTITGSELTTGSESAYPNKKKFYVGNKSPFLVLLNAVVPVAGVDYVIEFGYVIWISSVDLINDDIITALVL